VFDNFLTERSLIIDGFRRFWGIPGGKKNRKEKFDYLGMEFVQMTHSGRNG
jgi:hypothetical protein